jgi:hypothetical protein
MIGVGGGEFRIPVLLHVFRMPVSPEKSSLSRDE